jgi:prepilin-type N-terminal cleavage/methylation domain-containing protein
MKTFRNNRAFSLVELMVVVAIISVLAAIAIPRFRTFQAKARQAEAKTNLAHLFTLEESYHGDNDIYVELSATSCCSQGNSLGFYIAGGCCAGQRPANVRYMYSVNVPGADGSATTSFTAIAISEDGTSNKVSPGCPADQWSMDQDQHLTPVNDSVVTCGEPASAAPASH